MLKRLDFHYKEKTAKNTNTGRLNNTFLKNEQLAEEIKREIKKILETSDTHTHTHTHTHIYICQ